MQSRMQGCFPGEAIKNARSYAAGVENSGQLQRQVWRLNMTRMG